MDLFEALVREYRNVEKVRTWSDPEKSAARSILRAVAVRADAYREFMVTSAMLADVGERKNLHSPFNSRE